jgi:hypothetical protein
VTDFTLEVHRPLKATDLFADSLADFPSGGPEAVRNTVLAKRNILEIQPPAEPAEPVPVHACHIP